MPNIPDNQFFLDRVTSQHRIKPKYMAWLEAILNAGADLGVSLSGISDAFTVDNATGEQLDTIGEIVGMPRILPMPLGATEAFELSDEDYRRVIRAKIVRNQWDGTIGTIQETWDGAFDDVGISVIDNQDMTMEITLTGNLSPIAVELISRGYIVPKPAGVGTKIVQRTYRDYTQYVDIHTAGTLYTSLTLRPMAQVRKFTRDIPIHTGAYEYAEITIGTIS